MQTLALVIKILYLNYHPRDQPTLICVVISSNEQKLFIVWPYYGDGPIQQGKKVIHAE